MKNFYELFVLILKVILKAFIDFLKCVRRTEKENIFVLKLFLKSEHTMFEVHNWETLNYEFTRRRINLPVHTMSAFLMVFILVEVLSSEYIGFIALVSTVSVVLGILADLFFAELKRERCFGPDEGFYNGNH